MHYSCSFVVPIEIVVIVLSILCWNGIWSNRNKEKKKYRKNMAHFFTPGPTRTWPEQLRHTHTAKKKKYFIFIHPLVWTSYCNRFFVLQTFYSTTFEQCFFMHTLLNIFSILNFVAMQKEDNINDGVKRKLHANDRCGSICLFIIHAWLNWNTKNYTEFMWNLANRCRRKKKNRSSSSGNH